MHKNRTNQFLQVFSKVERKLYSIFFIQTYFTFIYIYIWQLLTTIIQSTYLIALCWFSINDTTVLFINPLRLCNCEIKNKTGVYLPKTNRKLLGYLHYLCIVSSFTSKSNSNHIYIYIYIIKIRIKTECFNSNFYYIHQSQGYINILHIYILTTERTRGPGGSMS